MPIISFDNVRDSGNQRKQKKLALQKKLGDAILKDILAELDTFEKCIEKLENIIEKGYVTKTDLRLRQVVIPTLYHAHNGLQNLFDKNDPYYDHKDSKELRQIIVNDIAHSAKYAAIVDRISRL